MSAPAAGQDAATATDMGIDVGIEDGSEDEGEVEEAMRQRLIASSSKEMQELDAQQEAAYNLQMKEFNLKSDLEKINCAKYFEALQKLGYSDLVIYEYVI